MRDELSVLAAFLAVAEERIGARLLARTTRSVAPTAAGEQLMARLGPVLGDVQAGLEQVSGLRHLIAVRVSPDPRAAVVGPPRSALSIRSGRKAT